MRKRLGIFNMFWHVTWLKASFVLLVAGGIQVFRMKEVCEEYCYLVGQKLKLVPIYFEDMLSEMNWGVSFLLSLMMLMIVLYFVPLWQGNRNGFYTQLRLPIRMKEYVLLQWIHALLWFFLHWVSQLGVLYLLFEVYKDCVVEEFRGTTSFIFGIIRSDEVMRWYPLVALGKLIPWVIQVFLLAFTPVYAGNCILTGHKWGTILIVIHVVGVFIIWMGGTYVASIVLGIMFSMLMTAWMVYLTKDYLTLEKGL